MSQIIFCLLIILPLSFQILFGIESVADRIKLSFAKVSLISIFSQFVFAFIDYKLLSDKLRMRSNGQIHCGLPLVGLVTLELFLVILILVIILIQFSVKKFQSRTTKL